MKTSLLFLLAVLHWVTAMTVLGANTNEARVYGNVVRGFAGRQVGVPWGVQHTGSVSGLQFDLNYATNKLTAGAFRNATLPINVKVRTRLVAPGQYRVLFYTTDKTAFATNLNFGSLPFTIPTGDVNGGDKVSITNAIVSRTNAIAAAPVALINGGLYTTPIYRGEDGVVDLLLMVQSNKTYVVQATTNFTSWVNIATNFAIFDYIVATDADAPNYSSRFYRAALAGSTSGGQISNATIQGGSQLTFGYATTSGKTYVLQASTNLTAWSSVTTNVATGALLNFTNLILPSIPRQFYRVMESP